MVRAVPKTLFLFAIMFIFVGCSSVSSATPSSSTSAVYNLQMKLTPDPPQAMKPLAIEVIVLSAADQTVENAKVTVDLSMPGMVMADNKPQVTNQGKGVYVANTVLPMSGDWQLAITISVGSTTETYRYPFTAK